MKIEYYVIISIVLVLFAQDNMALCVLRHLKAMLICQKYKAFVSLPHFSPYVVSAIK